MLFNNLTLLAKLPVADWMENFTTWMTNTFAGLFAAIQSGGQATMDGLTDFLLFINPWVWIIGITILAFIISTRRIGITLFSFFGLLFIYNQGLWSNLMNTLTLVLLASLVSIIIGVPLGIWAAKSNRAQSVIKPILDFMQTMPAFVYLIPAVAFFGIGVVPGVFSSVIFALPPTVRMTDLGIRGVSTELIEAADSFGSSAWQKLIKVELPMAKNTILAGVNQTLMLALSMVVTASMIGAPGLGRGVLSALQRAQVGNGFVNGLALVILAIIIDRFTQYANERLSLASVMSEQQKKRRKQIRWITVGAAVLALIGVGVAQAATKGNTKAQETVNLSYVQWDSEVASTNVVGEVLRQMGYDVKLTALDNAVMWQSVGSGESDGMVSAWLPVTHKEQYDKYKSKVQDLGVNLKGVKVGLVVPSYMKVDSIADLTNEAGKTVTGIEPGAGVVSAAQSTVKAYDNLAGWQVSTSSTGAMAVALGKAIKEHKPLVITGWSPHWMFSKYDLKYLKDPKGAMGKSESIHTIARQGLKDDMPEVYKVLDNFHWTQKDMEEVMLEINGGASPRKAAQNWIKSHKDEVAEWQK